MAKIRNIKDAFDEKYPNIGKVEEFQERKVNDDNYFQNHEKEQVAKKFIQMTVFCEALNEVLELDQNANVEMLAFRIRDLSIRSRTI